jgi:hypothetical protein
MKDGRYRMQCVGAALGYSKNGAQQIEILLREPETGEECSFFGYFSGKAAPITLEVMTMCGWDKEDPMNFDKIRGDVDVTLEPDTYEGKTSQKVRIYPPRPPGSLRTKEKDLMRPDEGKELFTRLGVIREPAPNRQPRRQAPPPAPRMREPGEDDDIAF